MKASAPLVGITTYHVDDRGYVHMPAQYAEAVRRAGGIPLLIQPGEPRMDDLMHLLDAIILAGGGDIDPDLYSDSKHALLYSVNQQRDQFEIDLVKRTLAEEKPLLCICRGLQVLNVALGGTLIQHIPDVVDNALAHRNPPREPSQHEVDIQPGSHLAAILQHPQVTVASWHHQSIDRIAPGLQVVGRAADGVIEAVEFPERSNVIAVQWHPELTAERDAIQQAIFDRLVKLSAESIEYR